jgi:hypothetical protein
MFVYVVYEYDNLGVKKILKVYKNEEDAEKFCGTTKWYTRHKFNYVKIEVEGF